MLFGAGLYLIFFGPHLVVCQMCAGQITGRFV